MQQRLFRFDPFLLLLFALSLWALTPLLSPGYFYAAHDGRHSVFYVSMFDAAMRDGAWWPRWAMHHAQGYGYPTFIVQAPVAFYIAEIFILLGAGITNAVKLTWVVGFLVSGWGMYALVNHWLAELENQRITPDERSRVTDHASGNSQFATRNSQLPALLAALLYIYAPYHLLDIYVRAALAETMLLAWLPWVFLAFDRLITKGTSAGWQGRLLRAALSFAGLLLTHVLALLAVTPLLAAFILFRLWMVWRNKQKWISETTLAATAGVAALLLSAIFVLPLLVEGPLLAQEVYITDTYDYARHWVQWGQFFSSFWGYGYSDDPVGANDGIGFQLGALLVILAIGGLMLFVSAGVERGLRSLLGFLLLAALAVLVVMTPAAAALWSAVPTLAVVQFPWRLLLLTAFLLSALGGLTIWGLGQSWLRCENRHSQNAAALLLGLLVVLASNTYTQASSLQAIEPWREDGRAVFEFEAEHPDMLGYTQQVEERFTQSPLTEQYALADFSNDKLERLGILADTGQVLGHYSRGHSFGGEVEMDSAGVVQVRVYDFPGWQVQLDGQPVVHRVSPPYGLIELDVPDGRHQIDVRMGTTPVRSAGMAISGGTLLLLVGLWGWGRRNRLY